MSSHERYYWEETSWNFYTDWTEGSWEGSAPAPGMNLNHWADEAWAEGSWVAAAWGQSGPTPTVVIDTHVEQPLRHGNVSSGGTHHRPA